MAPPDVRSVRRPEWLAERGGAVELLRVPSAIFGALSGARARLFDLGLLPAARLDVPVVSVGNLSTGGTGKSPCVALVCRELRARGRRPAVLSRGYAAPGDGANDEALVLARELPDLPQRSDPDRLRGGERLVEESGCDVVVLDDGFQHRSLARDLDLVLVDALRPWGLPAPSAGGAPVRALLPRGLLRERPSALARADLLVLTRTDQLERERLAELEEELESLAPGRPIAHAIHRPRTLRRLVPDARDTHLDALAGRLVDVVSGIGNPAALEATLHGLGARVAQHRAFPDHHAYRPADLEGLGAGERWIVTTEKDAVKLERLDLPQRAALRVLGVELELVRGAGVLDALLDALAPGSRERERAVLHEGLHG